MNANIDETKTQKTEDTISDALLMLLADHNFEDISVNDICKAAKINRGVFYSYFTDKYDLLNYCFNIKT